MKMTEQGLYTFNEVLERLLLTDEEVLLCKQHTEYNKKLTDMLDVNSTGDLVEKPIVKVNTFKEEEGYYGA